MEYNKDAIDEILKKKIYNSAVFKSQFKNISKTNDDDGELIQDYYNIDNDESYKGYSFFNSHKDGFVDNSTDDLLENFHFGIPGSPGTPKACWKRPGLRTDSDWPCDGGGRRGCCCGPWWWEGCWTHLNTWTRWTDIEDCVPAIPGFPGIGFDIPDIPSFEDMFNKIKDKINKDVVEPMENDGDRNVEDLLKHFFNEYVCEIYAFMVFLFVYFFSVLFTENSAIVCLFSLFISSLFLICIRDA
jgi:hypothetical protein